MEKLIVGFWFLVFCISPFKLALDGFKVVKVITDVIFFLYGLASIVTTIVVWVKTDWMMAFIAAIVLCLPLWLYELLSKKSRYTEKDWENASPFAPGSRHVNPDTGKPWYKD